MPDFLLMVLEDERAHAAQTPAATAALIDARAHFAETLRANEALRDHGRFRPSHEGRRARRAAGQWVVTPGPFDEEGRALGAYFWVQAASLDEATQWALRCPCLASDRVDVRPLRKGRVEPNKESLPGKLFGCVVLGRARDEAAWTRCMDLIDAETTPAFPSDAPGGLRLESPTHGRRVERGARAMHDGPFLESKEVIGGVFFLRAARVDDVLRWLADSPHGVHGAVEIRELWRC